MPTTGEKKVVIAIRRMKIAGVAKGTQASKIDAITAEGGRNECMIGKERGGDMGGRG